MKFLTTAEVADTIRKSEDYVARLCAGGQIRAKKLGNEWRIREEALDEFMDSGKAEPTRPERKLTKKQREAVEQRRRAS